MLESYRSCSKRAKKTTHVLKNFGIKDIFMQCFEKGIENCSLLLDVGVQEFHLHDSSSGTNDNLGSSASTGL